jgi:hypothetical protein
MAEPGESSELVSIDNEIDAIASEALKEARRLEEAQRYRDNPGPIAPPANPSIERP